MAAVLACGPGAVLSHRSAAALHGLRRTDRAADRRHRSRPHGASRSTASTSTDSMTLTDDDITVVDNIPCTSVARTLVRPRQRRPAPPGRAGLRPGRDRARSSTCASSRPTLERNRHTRACRVLKRSSPTTGSARRPSPSSRRCCSPPAARPTRRCPSARSGSTPATASRPIRADFVWREQRLIVETDGGRFHRTRRAFEADRRRDQRLLLAGWRVIRITWRQLKHERRRVTS